LGRRVFIALFFSRKDNKRSHDMENTVMQGQIAESPTGDLFFSRTNINALHEGIRYSVFRRSGHVIGHQNDMTLQIIMRSIFLTEARRMSGSVLEQVRGLNALVLDFAVDNILGALDSHLFYVQDTSKMPMPLEQSENVSRAGSRLIVRDQLG
jgi:hypothetical protein